jgi:hypothetical protein
VPSRVRAPGSGAGCGAWSGFGACWTVTGGGRADDAQPVEALARRAPASEHLERHVHEGDAADPYEATYAIWNGCRVLHTLATGSPDGTISLFDLRTQQSLGTPLTAVYLHGLAGVFTGRDLGEGAVAGDVLQRVASPAEPSPETPSLNGAMHLVQASSAVTRATAHEHTRTWQRPSASVSNSAATAIR